MATHKEWLHHCIDTDEDLEAVKFAWCTTHDTAFSAGRPGIPRHHPDEHTGCKKTWKLEIMPASHASQRLRPTELLGA